MGLGTVGLLLFLLVKHCPSAAFTVLSRELCVVCNLLRLPHVEDDSLFAQGPGSNVLTRADEGLDLTRLMCSDQHSTASETRTGRPYSLGGQS